MKKDADERGITRILALCLNPRLSAFICVPKNLNNDLNFDQTVGNISRSNGIAHQHGDRHRADATGGG